MSDEPSPGPLAASHDEGPVDGSSPTLDAVGGSASHPSGGGGGTAAAPPGSLGRFQISSTLGAGGMGVVYLAEDPSLGRKVAIKLLHAERAHSASAQARLQREARALASLSHPNVVVVHEVGVHDDQVYLVMEHVAGPTLREWARAHAGDWQAIVSQYRAAGEGLAAAHRAGIIHRDFKPDNVIVDEDGRPRVLDFGLASPGAEPRSKDLSWEDLDSVDLTKTGSILGTPAYMAPEQFLKATIDARTDQFSFCVALWEALFGSRPFGGDDIVELCSRVIAGELSKPPSPTRVPRSVIAALVRGLATKPDARFASMSELLQALAEPRRRSRGSVVAASSAAIGALAMTAWLLRGPPPTDPRSPSSPASPAVAAPVEPVPTPAPELPVPTLRQRTQTTGYGVVGYSVGVRHGVVIYWTSRGDGSGSEQWLLPLAATDARPLGLPVSATAVVHPGLDESFWIVEDEAISRAWPGGRVERIVDRGDTQPGLMGRRSWIAPGDGAVAIANDSGFEVWDLTGTHPEPVRFQLGSHPEGLAWSPDASRIAVTVKPGWNGGIRFDVFDMDGSLRLSTPWPAAMGGQPLTGLAWLPTGLVALLSDASTAWVQCIALTDAGITPGRRSAGMATSQHTELVGAVDDRTLLAVWPDVQGHLVVLELLGERAQQGPLLEVRRNEGHPLWQSETELAFLAAQPPGALVKLDLDDPARLDVLAPGPFAWASGDGEGGVVLGAADGETVQYWPKGAVSPHELQLAGVGSSNPFLRCRTARDCLMVSIADTDTAFLGVDLEQEHVRRRFGCPSGALCRSGRWGQSHDGSVLVVDEEQRALWRLHPETGERLGAPQPAPPWALIQSATQTSRGELVLTGMLVGVPPEGPVEGGYVVMRREDDGSFPISWSSGRTWVVRPRASPSGRRVVLEGLTFRSELMEVELGSLCTSPP